MTGPEHYRRAEQIIAAMDQVFTVVNESGSPAGMEIALAKSVQAYAQAQVHATLALTAATAYKAALDYSGDEDGSLSRGWSGVV